MLAGVSLSTVCGERANGTHEVYPFGLLRVKRPPNLHQSLANIQDCIAARRATMMRRGGVDRAHRLSCVSLSVRGGLGAATCRPFRTTP